MRCWLAVACIALLLACGGGGPRPAALPAPSPPPRVRLADFEGSADGPGATLRLLQPPRPDYALASALPESGGSADTVTISGVGTPVTDASTCGPGVLSFSAQVAVRSNFAGQVVEDVYAVLDAVSDTGTSGCNSAPDAGGLTSAGGGLWSYGTLGVAGGGHDQAVRTWSFQLPSTARFTFHGHLEGTTCAPGTCARCAVSADCPAAHACDAGTCRTGPCVNLDRSLKGSQTTCRPAADVCDAAERCTGLSVDCPADAFLPATATCRNQSGACDLAERCTGSSAACPADVFRAATYQCHFSLGPCDGVAYCPGTTGGPCPSALKPAGTACGAAPGPCAEVPACTGASAACPAAALRPAGTVCRAAADACDAVETCAGDSSACPADARQPAGATCRPAASACDLAETCPGGAATCPPDLVVEAGTSCDPGFAHGTASCGGGLCGHAACAAGWADCNGDPADGCEADVGADVASCGACGRACPTDLGAPICSQGRCASDAHLLTAVGAASVWAPGQATAVHAGDVAQFTVRVPGAVAGQPAEVWYLLARNLAFQGATAGGQPGPICTPGIFPGPYPDGVQGSVQALDCLLADGTTPLVVSAVAAGSLPPRDDPWSAVACFAPFDRCVPVRTVVDPSLGGRATVGPLRTALVLASAPGAPAHPYADKAATASVFFAPTNPRSARAFLAGSSYGPSAAGAVQLVGAGGAEGSAADVLGPFVVPAVNCMSQDDVLAAAAGAIDFTAYDWVVMLGHDPVHCAGGGSTGSYTVTAGGQPKTVPISIDYGTAFGDATLNGRIGFVSLHEFGHQLGLGHAGGWACPGATLASDGRCTNLVYDDPTDEMGGGNLAHFNPVSKERLGWLEGGRVLPVWSSGRHTLGAYEDPTEEVKVLKVPRKLRRVGTSDPGGLASGWFYVAARRPAAPFADWLATAPSHAAGVTLYLDEGGSGSDTAVLDLTPGSIPGPADFRDGALPAGQAFTDPLSGITVSVVTADAAGAVVDVVVPQRSTRWVAAASSDGYGGAVAGAAVTGTGSFPPGSTVTLAEVPPPGWTTFYWMDAAWRTVSGAHPWSFTLQDDTLVYASFKAVAPPNDAFAAAADLALPSQVALYTKSATLQAGEPSGYTCGANVVTASCTVWYRIVSAASGTVTLDTTGSDFLASLAVFTGSGLGALTAVPGACAQATVATQKATVAFPATAGTTYWLQVGAATVGQNLALSASWAP